MILDPTTQPTRVVALSPSREVVERLRQIALELERRGLLYPILDEAADCIESLSARVEEAEARCLNVAKIEEVVFDAFYPGPIGGSAQRFAAAMSLYLQDGLAPRDRAYLDRVKP